MSEKWNEPEMEKRKRKYGNSVANGAEITQSNGEGDHAFSN